jgi:hypothetical protein
MNSKISIDRNNHFRAILTDTLPYETPFFFTNEKLYSEASACFADLPGFVRTIFESKEATKPETYLIQKGGGAFRRITIMHPSAQLRFATFYEKFDAFIENACARSKYSLRFPSRVGSYFFQKQHLDQEENDNDGGEADIDPASLLPQRKWASTYFSYKRYSQIHKFFLSDEFNQFERKYTYMMKVDIARCFESIYAHAIAWSLRGKDFAKEHKNRSFFEAEFDKIMRDANWGETAGIPIGPEVSRIFAEIVMQSIDVAVEFDVKKNAVSAEIRRYVDDYFIFSNSVEALEETKSLIEKHAASFNLHLNHKKTETIHRPLIAKLAIARFDAMKALSDFMDLSRDSLDASKDAYFGDREAEKLIASIRRIARANDTDYAALASPCLAVLSKYLAGIRKRIDKVAFDRKAQGNLVIGSCMRVAAFIYQKDIRAATTHKMSKIFYECSLIMRAMKSSRVTFEAQIEDIVRSTLELSSLNRIHGPEIVNLLAAADAICTKQNPVTPNALSLAIGRDLSTATEVKDLGYFDLVSALYFSRNRKAFELTKRNTCSEIERRIVGLGRKLHLNTSETMLFFDYISCPYIRRSIREQLFSKVSQAYGNNADAAAVSAQTGSVSKRLCFIAWSGGNQLRSLLERRELQPAYDS